MKIVLKNTKLVFASRNILDLTPYRNNKVTAVDGGHVWVRTEGSFFVPIPEGHKKFKIHVESNKLCNFSILQNDNIEVDAVAHASGYPKLIWNDGPDTYTDDLEINIGDDAKFFNIRTSSGYVEPVIHILD